MFQVYKFYRNSYSEVGSAMSHLNLTLLSSSPKVKPNAKSVRKIGIYYDDPAIVKVCFL
jgi:hypothetical protein